MQTGTQSFFVFTQDTIRLVDPAGPTHGPVPVPTRLQWQPVIKLMRAILEDAMHNFQRCYGSLNRRDQRTYAEDRDWLLSEEDYGIFSCDRILTVLDIDPTWFRAGIRAWVPGVTAPRSPMGRPRGGAAL